MGLSMSLYICCHSYSDLMHPKVRLNALPVIMKMHHGEIFLALLKMKNSSLVNKAEICLHLIFNLVALKELTFLLNVFNLFN